MRTFKLSASVTISIYTEVEAETLEEAIEISRDRGIERSEWRNDNQVKEFWTCDEYDGEPQDIRED